MVETTCHCDDKKKKKTLYAAFNKSYISDDFEGLKEDNVATCYWKYWKSFIFSHTEQSKSSVKQTVKLH